MRKSTGILIFQKQTGNQKTPLLVYQVFYGFDYIRITKTSNTSLHYTNTEIRALLMTFFKWDVKMLKLVPATNTKVFNIDLWIALLHTESFLVFFYQSPWWIDPFHWHLKHKILRLWIPCWLLPLICYHNINHQSLSASTADFLGPVTKSIS